MSPAPEFLGENRPCKTVTSLHPPSHFLSVKVLLIFFLFSMCVTKQQKIADNYMLSCKPATAFCYVSRCLSYTLLVNTCVRACAFMCLCHSRRVFRFGVSHFVESSLKSSFKLLEFLLDQVFCDKINRVICSIL